MTPPTDDTSFAGHPVSVAEIRADRDGDAASWSPRDVLVAALRDIDEGRMAPDTLAICWRERKGTASRSHFLQAGSDPAVALGVVTRAAFMMQEE